MFISNIYINIIRLNVSSPIGFKRISTPAVLFATVIQKPLHVYFGFVLIPQNVYTGVLKLLEKK